MSLASIQDASIQDTGEERKMGRSMDFGCGSGES